MAFSAGLGRRGPQPRYRCARLERGRRPPRWAWHVSIDPAADALHVELPSRAEGFDPEVFAHFYNPVAEPRRGWRFDAAEQDVEHLRREFEQGGWTSLKSFAESRFEYDQRT